MDVACVKSTVPNLVIVCINMVVDAASKNMYALAQSGGVQFEGGAVQAQNLPYSGTSIFLSMNLMFIVPANTNYQIVLHNCSINQGAKIIEQPLG